MRHLPSSALRKWHLVGGGKRYQTSAPGLKEAAREAQGGRSASENRGYAGPKARDPGGGFSPARLCACCPPRGCPTGEGLRERSVGPRPQSSAPPSFLRSPTLARHAGDRNVLGRETRRGAVPRGCRSQSSRSLPAQVVI